MNIDLVAQKYPIVAVASQRPTANGQRPTANGQRLNDSPNQAVVQFNAEGDLFRSRLPANLRATPAVLSTISDILLIPNFFDRQCKFPAYVTEPFERRIFS